MKNSAVLCLALISSSACQAPDHGVAQAPAPEAAPGISKELAEHRVRTLSDVRYDVAFTIPDEIGDSVQANATIRFVRSAEAGDLVLDFAGQSAQKVRVSTPGKPATEVPFVFTREHVVVDKDVLHEGENAVEVEFVASDSSLNRRESYLYTLFVPARAHRAFPCFDQPDLKARYRLVLETPADWQAVGNGPLAEASTVEERKTWTFAETAPISTYLFAFAAGQFEIETAERNGRTLRFFHRETDAEKLERNAAEIFDLHATALAWLEDYTAIDYPFAKLDFVLVPGFQYGGMEHPGAIFYRDRSLMLDESATQDQFLGRASLIAHEVAHMWFGDLVTMPWFDDVWMKEVFANFMAAKIVHPSFPGCRTDPGRAARADRESGPSSEVRLRDAGSFSQISVAPQSQAPAVGGRALPGQLVWPPIVFPSTCLACETDGGQR